MVIPREYSFPGLNGLLERLDGLSSGVNTCSGGLNFRFGCPNCLSTGLTSRFVSQYGRSAGLNTRSVGLYCLCHAPSLNGRSVGLSDRSIGIHSRPNSMKVRSD